MRYIIIIAVLALTGCNAKEQEKDGSGTIRYEIFQKCMELAALSQSPQHTLSTYESELSDVVDSCSNESYYMSNHISSKG